MKSVTQEDKEKVKEMISRGEKIAATDYIRRKFNISLKEAYEIVRHLKKDMLSQKRTSKNTDPELSGKSRHLRLLPLMIFVVLGAGFLIASILLFYNSLKFKSIALPLVGVVIDQVYEDGYAPTIAYRIDDVEYIYESSFYQSEPYEINSEIDILVDPMEPERVRVSSFMELWFLSIFFAVFGISFAGAGIFFLIVFRNR